VIPAHDPPAGGTRVPVLGTRPSTVFALVGALLVVLGGTGALGGLSTSTFSVVGTATIAAFVVGIRRNRPALGWGWIIICVALVLFVAGGAAREALHTLGNLTSSRSLVPDLITLPGYVLLAVGATAMASSGHNRRRPDLDVLLDSVIASLGVLALEWVYLIAPALAHTRVPLHVRVLLACYPAMSAFLVATCTRVTFRGRAHRVRAHQYLAVSFVCLLIGDMLYTLDDSRLVGFHGSLVDIPYGLAFIAAGASALHPSMAHPTAPDPRARPAPTKARLAFVASALGIPAVVTAFGPQLSGSDRDVVSCLALILTACAIWRVTRALGAHADSQLQLVHQATHDMLTGLPNRRVAGAFVTQCLTRAAVSGRIVALVFLDIDRFKMVNDTFGHSVGDELLLAVARRLQGGTQTTDLVARLGGDEFVIVIDDLPSTANAVDTARRIHGLLRDPFTVGGAEIFSTASIGIACGGGTEPPTDAETLIRNADLAMYQAKAAGRDGVAMFSGDVHSQVAERLRIERDLRHAVDRNELAAHYQPIVSLRGGHLIGFEALLRWHHPIDGQIPPDVFIPIAEETGLIVAIDEWVLDQACRDMAKWRRETSAAADLTVAVNVSARQFKELELLTAVNAALGAHRLPAGSLRIELTESLLIGKSKSTTEVLEELRRIGVGISIDDFGTGYSSLAYLQRYPVDCVKIDRSFVAPLAEDDTAEESLVTAIIAMCGALGMKTLAEGIEVESQREKLIELGCDQGQGWLFAKAIPAADVSALLLDPVTRLGAGAAVPGRV
jgi:diguanylate cyclase (GGDEF)-like protein